MAVIWAVLIVLHQESRGEVPGFVNDFGKKAWSGKRESDRDPLPGTRRFIGHCPGIGAPYG
jgi:hypothetical protein